jgi:hypothetical protein
MCEPTTIALIASAVIGAGAAVQQADTARRVGHRNQEMAEYAAQDAVRRGSEDAMAARRRGEQIKGAQRAKFASAGLDLSEGTPADIVDQTDFFAETDQQTLKRNAARQAWSARAQGANFSMQGEAAAAQANLSAFGSLLGSGGQVANKWYTYRGTTAGNAANSSIAS